MRFPVVLYDRLAEEASNAGMDITEYVTLVLAPLHGVDLPGPNPFSKRSIEPDDPNQPALPLGA